MTVLQLTSHLNVGGITRYVLSLSTRLMRRGHRVIIASDRGSAEEELNGVGVTHWPLPLHTSAELSWKVFRSWRRLSDRLQREPVDLIHAHTRVSQVIAHWLSRQHHIPYVTTWHGVFKRRLGRLLWPCTGDLTIAISQLVRQHLLEDFRVAPDRVRYIPNGVDPDHYASVPEATAVQAMRSQWGLSPQHPVIGGVGRMAAGRVKGFDLVLMAAHLLEPTMPTVEVLLAGDGPRRPFLEDVAERLALRARVHFVGSVNDIRVPLALMDVFVFSSRWPEGFGLSLIEAMAAGKPVVAVRSGAVPDIVEHERSGLLVPPEDPAALAEAIARLLKDREFAVQLGLGAQARIREHFSLERMTTDIEAVYRELVSNRPS